VSIDKNRSDFLAVIIIALLATAASLSSPLTFLCCAVTVGCAITMARMPESQAGYVLGALALASSGVASVVLINLLNEWPLPISVATAIGTMILTGLWLLSSWNKRMPVRYGEQINLNTIFGTRKIRGPTRIRKPRAWLGSRIIATLSLRPIKTAVQVLEIDVGPAPDTGTTLRIIRPGMSDLATIVEPTKIHAIELSVSYHLDGDSWFLLYNIPHAAQYTAGLGHGVGRDHPEYWNATATGYIEEEAPEVLRRVIHREGWSASAVRDRRELVAAHFHEELCAEAAAMGIIIDQVELLTVDIDAPETLRAVRNTSVFDQEVAESQARVGSVRIGLHRDILRQMQELLSDREHPLPPEAIAAIVRSQIRELSRSTTPLTEIEEVLEESLDTQRHAAAKASHSRPHQHTRGAA
jgi:hypothetical protein